MKAADCIGKTIREVIPQADPVQIEAYGKVALTGEPLVFEYFSKTFNRHIKVRAFCPQPGQFATIFEDITERKVAEEALRQSEENLNVLFNVTDESIFLLDKDRTIIWLNKVAADRFGRSLEEIAGCKISTLLPPDILDRRRPFIDNAINTKKKVRFEDERDGRWIVNNLYPIINEGGQVTRLAIYSRDITERKQREEEIKQKNSELHLLNAEKDKFFSILAHDLRSPFSSLLGFAQMMEEDLPTMTGDQVQKIAGSIKRSATNLFTLLENLLEWSRLQRGMISFTPSSFLLKPWLHENMMLAEEAAKKKDITINYEIPVDLLVYADEKMLGGLVRNLTSNSVKFTSKGGKVCVAARLMPDGWVEIRVQDSGIGMSKEMIAGVFRLDVDTRRKGTEKEPSTGLGLIICKEFVEKHSGKFWIESEAGKGSTFYFTIPGKGLSK